MSHPSRRITGCLAPMLLGLLVILIATQPDLTTALQYHRADIADGRLHLLVTGHLTHFGMSHLAWDVGALLALGIACGLREPRKTLATIAGSLLLIGPVLFCLRPDLATYRGLSGVDSALFGLLMVSLASESRRGFRSFLLVGLTAFVAKLSYEVVTGQALFVDSASAGFMPVPLAHLVGLVVGMIVAVVPKLHVPPRRVAVPVAVVLLCVSQSGCVTQAMWKRGVPTKVHNPHVVSGKANGAVVIKYGEGGDCTHVFLPIDRSPDSLGPLVYAGSGRSLAAIEQEVTRDQAEEVNRVVLPLARHYHGRDFRSPLATPARSGVASGRLGIEVFAFDAAGDPVGDIIKTNAGKTGARYPDNCQIFLLPKTQPREAGPIALVVDLVVTPVHWLSRSPLD
jgi:rhomboid family GlyGly-CTERM serine protease